MEWQACLDEYQKLIGRDRLLLRIAPISQVDSARRHGTLSDAVRVLTDLNLSIKKAYISSDGQWFMDVFHVTDLNGNKLTDESIISYIEQNIETDYTDRSYGFNGLTALELTGTDRVGLLSEVFAVLADLQCNVVDAKVWTRNCRIASLIYVKDCTSGSPIEDSERIDIIEARLRNVLRGDNDILGAKASVATTVTHTERRLHQMMFAERDYERKSVLLCRADSLVVDVENWAERGYSVVNVRCKDRSKLLFVVVCTLTDMGYVVFHVSINTAGDKAYLLQSKGEHPRPELCTSDRQGLLTDVTRTFRENGLNVTRAEISTTVDVAMNVFYVKELTFRYHEMAKRQEEHETGVGGAVLLSIGSLVRKNLYNWGLIQPCSRE
ncbi:ACT domain-containing protein ACR8 [Hibiscus syriacus]|uniref:ACT domain-containing protein ACR n=1 Tax=Hibiscus syriacus TaxID=106335 RepID=A0A6A3CCI2_HIBSY|nr:ACT domain-containing protein ACR8 [Hibiscus syriacus]